MRHPFQSIPERRRKSLFWFLLASTLLLIVILNLIGAPLITSAAPSGIVSFELAGSTANSERILSSWNPDARMHAALSLGLDYLFMVAYAAAISLGCVWASEVIRSRRWPLASLGIYLAWGQWLAAILDAVENIGLIAILFSQPTSPWPEIARWCATFKFAIILLGLVYALYGLLSGVVSRFARNTKPFSLL
jgi:hypothetical protein